MTGLAATRPVPFGSSPSWAERLLLFVEESHSRAAALLLAISLACFLPGFATLQPMDRDEPRFAQATKQMVESGDYVDIRFQDEPRYKKPIGIHWLQAATVQGAESLGQSEARTTIAIYRLPSLAGALAAVLLTYWAALAFGGRREAFLAAALMAASLILSIEARLAKTDAVLLACTVAAMGGLARAWLARGLDRQPTETIVVFWLAVAAGVLIKGPMVVLFTGLAALALSFRERSLGWLRGLRPALGLLFVLLAVAPWFGAIAWKSGGEFYRLAVGDDMLGKVTTGQQNHFAPPGFYLVSFFATFWPGAVLAAMALPFAWSRREDDWIAFLLAWIVPAWLLFEAVPTKLPHYTMPLFPAFSILAVGAAARGAIGPWRPYSRLGFALLPLIPIVLAVAIVIGARRLDDPLPVGAIPVLAASCVISLFAWWRFSRGEVTRSMLAGVAASCFLSIGVLGLAQPVLQSLKLSPRLAALARQAPCENPAVASLGYREPSLVFLVGTDLDLMETTQEAAAFLAGGPGARCRILIVDSRFEPAVKEALGSWGAQAEPIGRVSGFNINGGRRVELGAYAARPQP